MEEEKLERLIELCDRYFVNPMVQPYAGANRECMFCGAIKSRTGSVDHSYSDCPVVKYAEIKASSTT